MASHSPGRDAIVRKARAPTGRRSTWCGVPMPARPCGERGAFADYGPGPLASAPGKPDRLPRDRRAFRREKPSAAASRSGRHRPIPTIQAPIHADADTERAVRDAMFRAAKISNALMGRLCRRRAETSRADVRRSSLNRIVAALPTATDTGSLAGNEPVMRCSGLRRLKRMVRRAGGASITAAWVPVISLPNPGLAKCPTGPGTAIRH
jgi:hypothetical protein